MVNVIIHPLGQLDHGEGSLLRVLNSPTHLESSNGSWDPLRELYAIEGGEAPTEEDLKRCEDEEAYRLQQAVVAAVDAERLRREEEDHQNLPQRGQRVHKEILQSGEYSTPAAWVKTTNPKYKEYSGRLNRVRKNSRLQGYASIQGRFAGSKKQLSSLLII